MEELDKYGNTEGELNNCCFPDCGCDGARLCMAKNGPSERAFKQNVENMYGRKDLVARRAKMELFKSCLEEKQ